ncbi:MAG TPA: di-heme oxidoredictase family protein [Gemmatimonadaceae bacterium]|nr:di-heme oxidoredictase family protein [Gemmatimonadaceae bacterium]
MRPFVLAVTAILVVGSLAACDQLTTVAPADGDVFDAPVEGLTPSELAAFARGDAEFGRQFAPNTGLGPIFNDVSCATCHSGDGRGQLRNALFRIGSESDDFLRELGGPQIQDKAIAGAEPELVPSGHAVSVRLPPPVFGVGLIEAIPESAILANVDSLDVDGDGISGRPNYVTPASFVPATEPGSGSGPRLGRFGRKAQNPVLLQQTVEAYLQDIGITSPFLPLENRNPRSGVPVEAVDRVADPEISESVVQAVTHYMRGLAPPAPGADTEQRLQGRALFVQAQCAKCHVPSFTTGPSPIAALASKEVTLYSDLLLHDMGDELADGRPDGRASGREWRTTPLWGLRLMRQFLNGEALLMHDGRARTVEQAILLHGGEASASRAAFQALSPAQRAALLDFVESR